MGEDMHTGAPKLPIMTGRFCPPQSTQISCHLNLNRQRNLVFEDPFLPLRWEEAELAEQGSQNRSLEDSELCPAEACQDGTAGIFSLLIFLRGPSQVMHYCSLSCKIIDRDLTPPLFF